MRANLLVDRQVVDSGGREVNGHRHQFRAENRLPPYIEAPGGRLPGGPLIRSSLAYAGERAH